MPIILGEHVTLDAGTGAVHTAPGHGLEDYLVGNRYGLPVDNPVGGDGRFLPDTPLFAGEHVFTANDKVVETLKARGALIQAKRFSHSYPHCWRHKTPIIFRATPQWFIGMEKQGLREAALREIEHVTWTPDWGQSRIEAMMRNRPDWCISRQRTWGVPIPLLVHKETGELHPRTPELIEAVARRVEAQGVEAWFALDAADLIGVAGAAEYEKVHDTLDVWFDSGVTHACCLEKRAGLRSPADLYLEGSDQHRGWFQSSLLTSVAMYDRAPYRGVLTHGFTVDAKGEKMSKSKGNVVSPQDVMKTLGADIIRLWVAATDYRGEMSVSDEILKRTADAYRRIRNTARFLLANLNGFDPAVNLVAPADMIELDRWAVDRAFQLQEEIVAAYRDYQFHLIYQKIHNFCVVDLGGFYLDVIKDRQYTTPTEGWCAGWRPSSASPPTRSGATCPASGSLRCSWPPGTRACSSWTRPIPSTVPSGTRSWRCGWRWPSPWRRRARPGSSAQAWTPSSTSTPPRSWLPPWTAWGTSCASPSSPPPPRSTPWRTAPPTPRTPNWRAWRCGCVSRSIPSACAAGTCGPTWAPIQSIRSCAGGAWTMSPGQGRSGVLPETHLHP